MLLDQQRGRHQHGDLLAVLHGLERGPHRDLGLAVSDVTADQPVHRAGPFHVGFGVGDRLELLLHLGQLALRLSQLRPQLRVGHLAHQI